MEEKQKIFIDAFDEYNDAIFRHCFFRVSDREVALDITQEAFTRIWKYMDKGKKIENMKTFLYTVANNLIIDFYRKHKTYSLPESEDGEVFDIPTNDHENIIASAEIEVVKGFLQKMDSPYRDILVMRYIDALSPEQIAETLKVSPNVVYVRINRAEARLRKLIHTT